MVTINNSNNTLSFHLKVEGSLLAETKAYAVLEFRTHKIQVPIKIQDSGECTVALTEKLFTEAKGKIMLEVITKDTIFTPWSDTFVFEQQIEQPKSITESKQVEKKKVDKPTKPKKSAKTTLEEAFSKFTDEQKQLVVLTLTKKLSERQNTNKPK